MEIWKCLIFSHHWCLLIESFFLNYSYSWATLPFTMLRLLFECINANLSFVRLIKNQVILSQLKKTFSLRASDLLQKLRICVRGNLWDAALLVIAWQSRSPDPPGPAWLWQSSLIRSSVCLATDTWSAKQLVSAREESLSWKTWEKMLNKAKCKCYSSLLFPGLQEAA